uniref:Uncharacterized protein n=1 Tax=Arundo donax TaxID=35708 RepID=A0A0A8YFY8_ARUDO
MCSCRPSCSSARPLRACPAEQRRRRSTAVAHRHPLP